MKKIIFVLCFLTSFSLFGQVPEFEWAFSIGGSENDRGYDITYDRWGSGDIYVTGVFRNTADFDPGSGNHDLTSASEDKIYLAKYTVEKELQWVATFPKGFDRLGYKVQTDSSGNVYMAGHFYGSGDFDPGPDTVNLTADGHDAYVVKLTSDGDFVWVKRIDAQVANAMVVDASGNSYTIGTFSGTMDFDPGPDVYNRTSNGNSDIFILKLNSDGDFVWAISTGGEAYESRVSIAIDQNNDVYYAGYLIGTIDFDPGVGTFNLTGASSTSDTDIFISKLSSEGTFLWAKKMSSSSRITIADIEIDQDQNLYASGSFRGTVDFDPGLGTDSMATASFHNYGYIVKLEPNGDYLWTKTIEGERGNGVASIAIDKYNALYVSGAFERTTDFDPGAGVYNLESISSGQSDLFLLKLDENGCFGWVRSIPSRGDITGGWSIAVDSSLNVFTGGRFYDSVDFDPDTTTYELSSNGYDDAFFFKLSQTLCEVEPTINSSNLSYVICPGDNIDLSVKMPSWVPNATYLWSTGETSDEIIVSPDSATIYTVEATYTIDNQICTTTASTEVTVILNATEIPYNDFDDDCDPTTLDNDLDQDGYLLFEDCDDNNPNIPAAIGSACDDGVILTTNDVIQADSCTCKGTFINGPNFEWVIQPWGDSYERGEAITTDSFGNVYVTGQFRDTVDFDPGPDVFNLSTSSSYGTYVARYNTDGQFIWAQALNSSSGSASGLGVTTDPIGNIYVTGSFGGTIDFDSGDEVYELSSNGSGDVFVLKLKSNGEFVWAKSMGGDGSDRGISIAVDKDGNVYTTGCHEEEADFDPGPEEYELDVSTFYYDDGGTDYRADIFISKLDSLGDFAWAKSIGNSRGECGYSLTLDSDNNIYVTGGFSDDSGDQDIYLAKLNTSGDFLWEKHIGESTDATNGKSIQLDTDNNIYITGWFDGSIDFDPGPDIHLLTSNGADDLFVLKLDNNGNYIWAKSIGAGGDDLGEGIMLDKNNNVYVIGDFDETVDFDPSASSYTLTNYGEEGDVFVLKLDSEGSFVWVGSFTGGGGDDWESSGTAITLDQWGNIYTTGAFTETTDFDPDTSTYELTSNGPYDAFIHKMGQPCNVTATISSTDSTATTPTGGFAICTSDSIFLQVNSLLDSPPTSYSWNTGATTESIQIIPDSTSSYTVTVTYDQGCTTLATTEVIVTDGITEIPYNGIDDDCNETTLDDDLDQDGFTLDEDCDDNNPLVNPNQIEIPYNGLDDDCDETTLDDDLDQDGYILLEDCDDMDSSIPTAAGTICNDEDLNTYHDVIQTDSCSCLGQAFINPPVFEWTNSIDGSGNHTMDGITTDRYGNVYVTGSIVSPITIVIDSIAQTLTPLGENDILIFKYSPTGDLIWAKAIGGIYNDEGKGIALDTFGNVYVTGTFQGTVDFDPGAEEYNLSFLGENDAFVMKLNTNGEFLWAKQLGAAAGLCYVEEIAVDENGNAYTTGYFQNTIDFDPGSETYNLTSNNSSANFFISKLNHDGDFLWAKAIGSERYVQGFAIALDSNNNVYTSGVFNETVDFDPGPGVFNLTSGNVPGDSFILKLDSNGDFIWAKALEGSSTNEVNSIAIDKLGAIHISGFFTGYLDLDPGSGVFEAVAFNSTYLLKLDSDGNFLWGKSFENYMNAQNIKSIAVDQNSNVYFLSRYFGPDDLDPGTGVFYNPSILNLGVFILKLSPEGDLVWVGSYEGINAGSGAIHLDNWDNIYTTGRFGATVDFDPGSDTFEITPSGSYEIFVHKLRQSPCNVIPELNSSDLVFDLCSNDSISISTQLPSGIQPISYHWNTGQNTSTISVTPDSTTTYIVSVNYAVDTVVCTNSAFIEIEVLGNTTEIPYNGFDDDCDPTTLDDDLDQDGFGIAEDCDDTNPLINPIAIEIFYNDIDDDCNEATADDDQDGDGFSVAEDCDDTNPLINPGNTEVVYNGLDDDCDETTLDDDLDQDGFLLADDCNDTNPLVNPDATEVPYTGIDEDCDESTLDDDLDQDGFSLAEDCDDNNADINPNAIEILNNGIDENCDGLDTLVSIKKIVRLQPQIFPNPTMETLHILYSIPVEGTYEITDIKGRLIFQGVLSQETTLDLKKQVQGIYILILKTDRGVWVERIVKV